MTVSSKTGGAPDKEPETVSGNNPYGGPGKENNGAPAKKKDIWDKADIILKGVLGVGITAAIGLYGMKSEARQTRESEANRKATVVVQTMNQRETSAAEMRAQMFTTLMQHYFVQKENPETQITILELIGLNFQEYLHLRPLFEKLDAQLTKDAPKRLALRKAAKRIKKSEIEMVVGNGGREIDLELYTDRLVRVAGLPIAIKMLDLQEAFIRITCDPLKDVDGFEVTFYDMPLMDNTRKGELVYSILLSDVDLTAKKAKVKVVQLPTSFMSSKNSLRFDAMIGDMTKEINGEK